MNETLFSSTWWLTATLSGIVASVVGAYLKSAIDRRLEARSKARHERSTKMTEARRARIADMRQSDRALLIGIRRELSAHVWSVSLYTLAILIWIQTGVLSVISLLAKLLALLLLIAGTHSFLQAMRYSDEVAESIN